VLYSNDKQEILVCAI